MANYVVYVARGPRGKQTEAFTVSGARDVRTAKAAFKRRYPNERIKTIIKARW